MTKFQPSSRALVCINRNKKPVATVDYNMLITLMSNLEKTVVLAQYRNKKRLSIQYSPNNHIYFIEHIEKSQITQTSLLTTAINLYNEIK